MDTRIALGVNPLVIPDQSASLQKALTLNALMGQSDLQNLNIQEGQRTLKKNQALDSLMGENLGDDEYLRRLSQIDRGAAFKLQQQRLEGQKTQGEVDKSNRENDAAIANAIINASPQDRPAVYAQLHQQEVAKGNKNAINAPPQWDEAMLPHIVAQQQKGLATKEALERQDYRNSGAPPTVAALSGQPPIQPSVNIPAASGPDIPGQTQAPATVRALQGPSPDGVPLPPVDPSQMPTVEKIAPADPTAAMRQESARLKSLNNEVADKRAKALDETANQIEQRVLQEKGIDESAAVRREAIAARNQNNKNTTFTNANKLADDYRAEPAVKSYRTVQPVYASMQEAAAKNTAASDLNLVYGISKIFDPDSVVREGEQVMVVNAGGLPSKVQSWIGMVNGGQKLSDTLRKEIMAEADSRVGALKSAHAQVSDSYTRQAKDNGLNPDDVVRRYDITPKSEKGAGPRGPGSGTQADPFKIKGDDGWSLVPKGQYYTAPDGSTRQKQ